MLFGITSLIIIILLFQPSSSEVNWLNHFPEKNTFIAYSNLLDLPGQFQFISMKPNVIVEGGSTNIIIAIKNWSDSNQEFYLDVNIPEEDKDNLRIVSKSGDGATAGRQIQKITTERYERIDIPIEIIGKCNGCRNDFSINISLEDMNGNVLHTENLMIRIYTPEYLLFERGF